MSFEKQLITISNERTSEELNNVLYPGRTEGMYSGTVYQRFSITVVADDEDDLLSVYWEPDYGLLGDVVAEEPEDREAALTDELPDLLIEALLSDVEACEEEIAELKQQIADAKLFLSELGYENDEETE